MKSIFFINIIDHEISYDRTPLGILSLVSLLNKHKEYDTKIIDFGYECKKGNFKYYNNFNINIDNMSNFILKKHGDVAIFYTMCNIYHIAVILAKKLKEKCPNMKIIFGGPHASLTATDTLRTFPWIDYVGLGEGENTVKTILHNIINSNNLDTTEGLAYRRDNQVINNGLPKLIKELDKLPQIDYSLVDMSQVKEAVLETGRGCPYSCIFCSTKTFWKRNFRMKSIERTVEEIKRLKNDYGVNNFNFVHDMFTANRKYIMDMCNDLQGNNINIKWTCSARVDSLDEELIKKMSEAGCRSIFLGVETGSPRMQKIINKNLDIADIYNVIDILFKYKVYPRLSFIYGFPQETENDILQTISMINKLVKKHSILINRVYLHKLCFYAGTELTDVYYDKLSYSEYNNETATYTNNLPQDIIDMVKNNKKIFTHFFEYKSELLDKVNFLDKFVSYIYLRTLHPFRCTYKFLMEFYDDNILQLFYSYKEVEERTLKISSYQDTTIGANKLINAYKSFNNFVNNSYFGDKDNFIKEMCKFEYDAMNFLYNSNKPQNINNYKYNVYDVKKDNIIEKYEETIIKFIRKNTDVIILKVDSLENFV